MSTTQAKTIRLGICMAGAVSAGAYTAGVIDYLIETLERWQQKKDEISKKKPEELTAEEKLVPMHNVVIEVLSGASAGGMTAAVLGYSFNDNSYINRREGKLIDGNYALPEDSDDSSKLYKAWIDMVDDPGGTTTLQKLMDSSDVVSIDKMTSILNSQPIDDIANKAIPEKIDFQNRPYISDNLSILLSVTNLEGIPVDIRFTNIDETDPTCNVLKIHSGFLHYQFKEDIAPLEIDFPPETITEKSKDHLAVAAKATGAFPFGLSNRKIVVNHVFFNEFKKRLKDKYKLNVNLELAKEHNYVFNAIDGGAINNEPIGSTMKILASKNKIHNRKDDNYLVLIDPFPTITKASKRAAYCEPEAYTMFQQVGKVISAFRNQSMYKQEDLLSGLEMDDNRFLISPSKKKYYYLASGRIEGFSGFFKKSFRQHDYQLGRKNCQAFLRYYFGETVDVFQQRTGNLMNEEQVNKWCYNANYGKENVPELKKIPLIPDMLVLFRKTKKIEDIEEPQNDGINITEFNETMAHINNRVKKIIDSSYWLLVKKGKGINRILGGAMSLFSGTLKKKILNFVSKELNSYLKKTLCPLSAKQPLLVSKYAPIITTKGRAFKKVTGVVATIAVGGEYVVSTTKGKTETSAIALPGDYIVTNQTDSQEKYILTPEAFAHRYVHSSGDFYKSKSTAQVFGLQVTRENIFQYDLSEFREFLDNPDETVYIEADWGESQAVNLNDYLVSPCPPNKKEVYGISLSEFNQTYKPA